MRKGTVWAFVIFGTIALWAGVIYAVVRALHHGH